MRFWSTLYIGGRKRHTLIDDGPYSVCRNPLYLGSFLLALSVGLFLKSFVFAIGLAAMVLIYVMTTVPAEEKDLRAILGAAYEDYCRRVPRFWPRFGLFHTEALVEVKMQFVWVEVKRMFVWVWLPILGELIGFLRGQPWWPCFVPFSLS
ncbi:MAG: isoprenylcysteine carboxylmethyltransferase family protein [Verrucomicrobia bacterium]|nr:isoprenylcysteine carboxylmethyltransferase family protein [Verrucomicrobiota bacterium]